MSNKVNPTVHRLTINNSWSSIYHTWQSNYISLTYFYSFISKLIRGVLYKIDFICSSPILFFSPSNSIHILLIVYNCKDSSESSPLLFRSIHIIKALLNNKLNKDIHFNVIEVSSYLHNASLLGEYIEKELRDNPFKDKQLVNSIFREFLASQST